MPDRGRLTAVFPYPAYSHGGRGPAGSLLLLGLDLLLDGLERPDHVGARRPAVQGIVIGRTQMPEHGIEVNISCES